MTEIYNQIKSKDVEGNAEVSEAYLSSAQVMTEYMGVPMTVAMAEALADQVSKSMMTS